MRLLRECEAVAVQGGRAPAPFCHWKGLDGDSDSDNGKDGDGGGDGARLRLGHGGARAGMAAATWAAGPRVAAFKGRPEKSWPSTALSRSTFFKNNFDVKKKKEKKY